MEIFQLGDALMEHFLEGSSRLRAYLVKLTHIVKICNFYSSLLRINLL